MRERGNQKVLVGKPWYTDDQFEFVQKYATRTIRRRYDFILESISGYQQCTNRGFLRVLDAGCGDGIQLQGLIQMERLEIWGIDYNPIRTERVKQKFENVKIICGDLLCMPFKPEVFDVVLCSQVIEHVLQDDLLLVALRKMIKTRGLLILGTPNEGCLMGRLRNHIFERNILKNTDHLHFYQESVIRRKIETAGFAIRDVMRENWFFPYQLISRHLANCDWGFYLMTCMNKAVPSQSAGYYFLCEKR